MSNIISSVDSGEKTIIEITALDGTSETVELDGVNPVELSLDSVTEFIVKNPVSNEGVIKFGNAKE